jgi:UDP-N-acetylglucosamine:LPS N-acetylglucosamine transferase
MLRDPEVTGERLARELHHLLDGGADRLREMGEAARTIGRPDAAAAVAAVVEEHAKRSAA